MTLHIDQIEFQYSLPYGSASSSRGKMLEFDFNTHSLAGVHHGSIKNAMVIEFQYSLPRGSASGAGEQREPSGDFNTHSLAGVHPEMF